MRGGHDLSCPQIPPTGHFIRTKPPKSLPPNRGGRERCYSVVAGGDRRVRRAIQVGHAVFVQVVEEQLVRDLVFHPLHEPGDGLSSHRLASREVPFPSLPSRAGFFMGFLPFPPGGGGGASSRGPSFWRPRRLGIAGPPRAPPRPGLPGRDKSRMTRKKAEFSFKTWAAPARFGEGGQE